MRSTINLTSNLTSILWSTLLLGGLLACNGNPLRRPASLPVGSAGGILRVTDGPLAGTVLEIPANALAREVTITIDLSQATEMAGFEVVGPAARFGPPGISLDPAAVATLPFDPDLVPAAASVEDFVVKRRSSQGRITDLRPTSVDLDAGTVTVRLSQFSAFWVGVRTDSAEFVLSDYFPLLDGDRYGFDNGLELAIGTSSSEPNLNGIPVTTALFVLGPDDFGLYLRRIPFGETLMAGCFSFSGDFQQVRDDALPWLPEAATLGSSIENETVFTGYTPFGSPTATFFGSEVAGTTLVSAGRLDTPLGRFEDVLELEFVTVRTDTSGVSVTLTDRFWFARDVGPVQVSLDGFPGPPARIVSGLVGGRIVRP